MDNDKESQGGIVPIISEHYQALPLFYDFENSKIEQLSDKISRQFIMGSTTMLVKWIFKKGAAVPLHYHPHEQITWITEGSCRVLSQGKSYIIKAGQSIIFPPTCPMNLSHSKILLILIFLLRFVAIGSMIQQIT